MATAATKDVAADRAYLGTLLRALAEEMGRTLVAIPGAPPSELASEPMVVPAGLRLLAQSVAGGLPMAVGIVQEALRTGADRRAAGAVYTPYDVARALVDRALPGEVDPQSGFSLVDPACGGGAFLVAAADVLHGRGWTPNAAIAALWGADMDPESVWVTQVALALWHAIASGSGPRTTVVDHAPIVGAQIVEANSLLEGRSAWPARTTDFAVVVGNPPYLGQLKRATTRSRPDTEVISSRFGGRGAGHYVDDALLFVLMGLDVVAPGGTVQLLLPESILASRDGETVRLAVEQQSVCTGVWWARDRVFDADVEVISIRFRKADVLPDGVSPRPLLPIEPTESVARWVGLDFAEAPALPMRSLRGRSSTVGAASWAWMLQGLHGVPALPPDLREPPVRMAGARLSPTTPQASQKAPQQASLEGIGDGEGGDGDRISDGEGGPRRVADLALATAGFRDEYYGLAPFVREAGQSSANHMDRDGSMAYAPYPFAPRLVTVGLIDPAHLRWGLQPTRFNRHRWERPIVDLESMRASEEGTRLARWGTERLVPKVLVASQTRVVEAVVDVDGTLWPSTPVVALVPHDPELSLWMLAAAVSSPHVTAWAMSHFRGSALVGDAVKLAAWQLEAIPLPTDRTAWEAGAAHFEQATAAAQQGDGEGWCKEMEAFAAASGHWYGDGPRDDLVAWWSDRLPPWRTGSLVAPS